MRAGGVATRLRDLAHQGQCARPLCERLVAKPAFVLRLVISERAAADRIQRIEATDRRQLVLQVAEHEADQPFGLPALLAGFVARLEGGDRERAGDDHPAERARGEDRQAAMAPRRIALNQLVEPDAEHSGNQLEQAEASAIASVAKVGGDRLGALPGRASAPIELVPERGREAFFSRRVPPCRWRRARHQGSRPARIPRAGCA